MKRRIAKLILRIVTCFDRLKPVSYIIIGPAIVIGLFNSTPPTLDWSLHLLSWAVITLKVYFGAMLFTYLLWEIAQFCSWLKQWSIRNAS